MHLMNQLKLNLSRIIGSEVVKRICGESDKKVYLFVKNLTS